MLAMPHVFTSCYSELDSKSRRFGAMSTGSDITESDDEWDPEDAPHVDSTKKRKSEPSSSSVAPSKQGAKAGRGGGSRRGKGAAAPAAKQTPGIHEPHTFSEKEVMAAVDALRVVMQKQQRGAGGGGGGGGGAGAGVTAMSVGHTGALEVKEQPAAEVMNSIERLVIMAAEKITGGETFTLSVSCVIASQFPTNLFPISQREATKQHKLFLDNKG
jgi:hypothetical protein